MCTGLLFVPCFGPAGLVMIFNRVSHMLNIYFIRRGRWPSGCKMGSEIKTKEKEIEEKAPHLVKLPPWHTNTAGGPGQNRIVTLLIP